MSKYGIFCFVIAVFIGGYSFAQKEGGRFAPNLHAGFVGTQVDGDGFSGFNKLGFQIGLGIDTKLSDQIDIGFEINLLQKGSIRRPDPENNDYRKYKMALLYTQIPVFVRYHVNDKMAFLAGPAFGVLLSAREFNFDGRIPTDPKFNTFELSAILEFQYRLSDKFTAGIRTNRSLLPIRTRGEIESNFLKGKQYNMTLGLYVYYFI